MSFFQKIDKAKEFIYNGLAGFFPWAVFNITSFSVKEITNHFDYFDEEVNLMDNDYYIATTYFLLLMGLGFTLYTYKRDSDIKNTLIRSGTLLEDLIKSDEKNPLKISNHINGIYIDNEQTKKTITNITKLIKSLEKFEHDRGSLSNILKQFNLDFSKQVKEYIQKEFADKKLTNQSKINLNRPALEALEKLEEKLKKLLNKLKPNAIQNSLFATNFDKIVSDHNRSLDKRKKETLRKRQLNESEKPLLEGDDSSDDNVELKRSSSSFDVNDSIACSV